MAIFGGDTGGKILKYLNVSAFAFAGLSGAALVDGSGAARHRAVAPSAGSTRQSRPAPGTAQHGTLPARLFDCKLGRITNFDPNHDQPVTAYVYDGQHVFQLFLPAIATRTTPPPNPTAPAEPVDPRTRIVADPDGIARDVAGRAFDRVVDLWPARVEMTTRVTDVAVNVIVIAQIDPRRSTATIFMTRANDAVTYDLKHLYYGQCRVRIAVR